MTGGRPSGAATALNIGTAVLGGVQQGISMQQTIKSLKIPSSPSSPTGPGTGR
jgi:hypothetical protein